MSKLSLCIVYISEAIKTPVLDILYSRFNNEGSSVGYFLLHSFKDVQYNRTSFYIAGITPSVVEAVRKFCADAFLL